MKNIVVCVDLREECLNVLNSLKERINLKESRIHFVHVFEIKMGVMELTPVVYPVPSQYPEIESSIVGIMDNLKRNLGLRDDQVEKHCFFSQSKEQRINEYLVEKKADMVILSTRGKHGIEGFFASSLADFLCKYSPCDILVMRPN